MKHKHYDMIVAKAANMVLVQFIKMGDNWETTGSHDNQTVNFGDHYDYFLCLPQHKEAVLSLLNGGEAQTFRDQFDEWRDAIVSIWNPACWYMQEGRKSRIKPRKEKRWIAVIPDASRDDAVTPRHYASADELKDRCFTNTNYNGWQFIEIEVEV
ncbi:hypothetical protein [Vibrio phage LP.1]|nr:hypothetical protein [Vibrio phage LP.1]